ncbi:MULTISPECIES: hypothetical protein [unclassified Streptomyces]|uniref:hypothetical protein n=1 Tax=unclassified Streptomyces TaxID=2593676 RepID=UPI0004CACD42|nr:hypothetical protein [Streptomyces sp. NRRL F-2747]
MSDSGSEENAPPVSGDGAAAPARGSASAPPPADGEGAAEPPAEPAPEGEGSAREAAAPAEAGAAGAGVGAEGGGSAPDEPNPEPYRVSVRDLGRFAVAAVTVLAALAGLVLGIRSEQRAVGEEQRAKEAREKAYADLVDFYRMGSEVIVVNGSSRVMAMRLTLPGSNVRWDLDLLQPCKQIDITNRSLLDSMAVEEPSVKLVEGDLAQLRLEFMDPMDRAWIRNSGGAVARTAGWKPSGRPLMVSSESWNSGAQAAPACDKP